jgi:hypothetical protein
MVFASFVLLILVAPATFAVVQINSYLQSQENCYITIKRGAEGILSVEVEGAIFVRIPTEVTVKVVDATGAPVVGADVKIESYVGLIDFKDSVTTGKTDDKGEVKLHVNPTKGGVIAVYLDDTRAKTLSLVYKEFPLESLTILVLSAIIYIAPPLLLLLILRRQKRI